jgi:putative MATE family efflux protein
VLRLAVPVLAEQFLFAMVGFSDTLLTGHYLDQSHLAAINLMAYVLWLMSGLFTFVAIGATAMIARFVGAGDMDSARKVANQALVIGAALAVVVTVLGIFSTDWLIGVLQLKGASAAAATEYLRYIVPVLPLIMLEVVGIASLRGAGDMVSGLLVMSIVNVVNIAVSWLLVLGPGPIPKLDWAGIAIGTMCGYAVGGVIVLVMLTRGRAGLRLRRRWLAPNFDLINRLLRIGIPGGIDTVSLIGCQLWFVSIINRLGDLAAASHGVAIRIESLAFLPGIAFQMAAATLAGQYLGAGDKRKAGRCVLTALALGGGIMLTAAVIFFYNAEPLAMLFVKPGEIDVAKQAAPLLRTISLAMPALALTLILSGALRGAGDTRWPLLFTLIGFLAIRIPGAYWLSFDWIYIPGTNFIIEGWCLGIVGAWYAMVIDLYTRSIMVLYRFLHGGWKRVKV